MERPDAIAWSIVLPLDGARRDPRPLLDALSASVAPLSDDRFEILAIDDGCPEETSAALDRWANEDSRLLVLRSPIPRGPGDAARHGILLAGGEKVLLAIDPPPLPEGLIARMEAQLDDRNDLVVASLRSGGPRPLPPVRIRREVLARLPSPAARLLAGRDAPLGPCPIHLYRRDAAREIYRRVRVDGPGFEVEALYLARRYAYAVLETPWDPEPGAPVGEQPDRRPPSGIGELLRIRYGRLRGDYG